MRAKRTLLSDLAHGFNRGSKRKRDTTVSTVYNNALFHVSGIGISRVTIKDEAKK